MVRGRLNIVNNSFTKLGGISKMKKLTKTLLFAFASLFLTSSLFAATIHEGDAAQKSFELTANKQYGDNYETQNNVGVSLPKEYEAKAGDKITIHVEGTVTNDIVVGERKGESSAAEILFVDCSPAASYWTEITDRIKITDVVKAGEKIVWDYTFVVTKDAQANSGKKGCRWVISSSPKQNKPVTFKTTKFTYKIER